MENKMILLILYNLSLINIVLIIIPNSIGIIIYSIGTILYPFIKRLLSFKETPPKLN